MALLTHAQRTAATDWAGPAPGRICRSSSPSYKGALLPAVPSFLPPPMRASASEATLLPRQAHYVLCFCVTSGMPHDFNSQRGIYLFLITSKVILSLLFPPSMTQPLSPDFPFSLKQDVPTSSISLRLSTSSNLSVSFYFGSSIPKMPLLSVSAAVTQCLTPGACVCLRPGRLGQPSRCRLLHQSAAILTGSF